MTDDATQMAVQPITVAPVAWARSCMNWQLDAPAEGAWFRLLIVASVHGTPVRANGQGTNAARVPGGIPQVVALMTDPPSAQGLETLIARGIVAQELTGDLQVSVPAPHAVSIPSLGTAALE